MARSSKKKKTGPIEELELPDLVDIIRSRGRVRKSKVNNAYNEVEKRLKPKILHIISQFFIPGLHRDDLLQESLYALRFKAVPDYNRRIIGRQGGFYPFDKFAVLCIRRHLSTILKSSFQNKRKALNTSLSLDQDRNTNSNEELFLSDILPTTTGNVLGELEDKEYYKNIFTKLYNRLSPFEKKVFLLYRQRYSYDEITDLINKKYKKDGSKKRINIKSIDNSLSRIKMKGKVILEKEAQDEEKRKNKRK